jgi:hypothetical protein
VIDASLFSTSAFAAGLGYLLAPSNYGTRVSLAALNVLTQLTRFGVAASKLPENVFVDGFEY